MPTVLNNIDSWCSGKRLSVNPYKTLYQENIVYGTDPFNTKMRDNSTLRGSKISKSKLR